MSNRILVSPAVLEQRILLIRGEKVLLDADLAVLYGVDTNAVTRAMARNKDRFPADFAFQLDADEFENLKRQFGVSSWGGRRSKPFAFTEQGVAMLSSVLRSKRAVAVNIEIMRAFVRLRELLSTHADLARKLEILEKKYDLKFKAVFDAIKALMRPPADPPKERMGFVVRRNKSGSGAKVRSR